MKPAFIAAIVLAFAVHLTPPCEAKEKAAEITRCANGQHPRALAAVLAVAVYTNQQGSAPSNDATPNQTPSGYKPPEWVLPLIAIITAGFICWQSWETRKASQATKDSVGHIERQAGIMDEQLTEAKESRDIQTKTLILQYRPRIIVRHATAKAFSKEIGEGVFSEPVRCVVAFQIVNIGGSPAHIVDGDIYLLSARSGGLEEEIEFKESTHVGIGQRTLQPGEREAMEFALDTRISNDARWVEFYKGTSSHRIFLLGTIWYRDDLGIPRQTGLHRSYDPKTKTFVPRKDSEEEYSD